MNRYSTKSFKNLATIHQDLQLLFLKVLKGYDHTIITGHRTQEEQEQHYKEGRSKTRWPNSKHNTKPSRAVDASPYPIPDKWGELNSKERAKFYHFAGYVKAVADQLNIKIRWGGDWDGDFDFDDQTFDDLVHFELIGD